MSNAIQNVVAKYDERTAATLGQMRKAVKDHVRDMHRNNAVRPKDTLVQVLVYADQDDYDENVGSHSPRDGGDFMYLKDALKLRNLLQPGSVWDVFLYHKGEVWGDEEDEVELGDLIDSVPITIPE